MPWKDIDKQRASIRRHYYANRQVYIDKALKRKKKIRRWIHDIKETTPCMDCHVSYPYYIMDFDHVGVKETEINKMINNCNIQKLTAEIAECEIVCANCHRIRTHKRLSKLSSIL